MQIKLKSFTSHLFSFFFFFPISFPCYILLHFRFVGIQYKVGKGAFTIKIEILGDKGNCLGVMVKVSGAMRDNADYRLASGHSVTSLDPLRTLLWRDPHWIMTFFFFKMSGDMNQTQEGLRATIFSVLNLIRRWIYFLQKMKTEYSTFISFNYDWFCSIAFLAMQGEKVLLTQLR